MESKSVASGLQWELTDREVEAPQMAIDHDQHGWLKALMAIGYRFMVIDSL